MSARCLGQLWSSGWGQRWLREFTFRVRSERAGSGSARGRQPPGRRGVKGLPSAVISRWLAVAKHRGQRGGGGPAGPQSDPWGSGLATSSRPCDAVALASRRSLVVSVETRAPSRQALRCSARGRHPSVAAPTTTPPRAAQSRSSPDAGRARTAPGSRPCLCKPRSSASARQAQRRAALLPLVPPSCPLLVSAASRLGELGDLTSFGALRPYDSRPRFPKKLKEWTPAADTS